VKRPVPGLKAVRPTPPDHSVAAGFKQGLELLTVGADHPPVGFVPGGLPTLLCGTLSASAEFQPLELERGYAAHHRIVTLSFEPIPRLELP
jgi:hypothetical protein